MKSACSRRGVTLIEMLVVLAILGVMTSIAYPSISTGLDSLRLTTACDDVASLLNAAANHAERRQEAVEIRIARNSIVLMSPHLERRLNLTGVTITDEERSIFIEALGVLPGVVIELENARGVRRLVRVDPITGVPEVKNVEAKQQ